MILMFPDLPGGCQDQVYSGLQGPQPQQDNHHSRAECWGHLLLRDQVEFLGPWGAGGAPASVGEGKDQKEGRERMVFIS